MTSPLKPLKRELFSREAHVLEMHHRENDVHEAHLRETLRRETDIRENRLRVALRRETLPFKARLIEGSLLHFLPGPALGFAGFDHGAALVVIQFGGDEALCGWGAHGPSQELS